MPEVLSSGVIFDGEFVGSVVRVNRGAPGEIWPIRHIKINRRGKIIFHRKKIILQNRNFRMDTLNFPEFTTYRDSISATFRPIVAVLEEIWPCVVE